MNGRKEKLELWLFISMCIVIVIDMGVAFSQGNIVLVVINAVVVFGIVIYFLADWFSG